MAYKYQSYVWQSLNAIAMTLQSYVLLYDDVIKWKHFLRYWSFARRIHRWGVDSPDKGQWRGALEFSFMCAWKMLSSNRDAGDFWRHGAHCNLIVGVMLIIWCYANDCPHRPRTITVSLPTKGDFWLTNLGIRSIHWLIFIFARCHHSTATLTHMKWMRDISEIITYFYNGWK